MPHHVLPEYPAMEDVWSLLKKETRPIVIYGMGNGADKLLSQMQRHDIPYCDFFASDSFVRGHTFHGIRVKTLREIRELYSDFVVVLSFASSREEVISLFETLDRTCELYIPDMPVAGEQYFTKEFYNESYGEICRAYDALSDELSRDLYAAVLHFKLTGRLSYLLSCTSTKAEIYSLVGSQRIQSILDGGAYSGDTAEEFLSFFKEIDKIHAVEPDPKTYRRLLRTVARLEERMAEGTLRRARLVPIHSALSSRDGECLMHSSANRNSSLVGASYEHTDSSVPVARIDSLLLGERVDFIKLDVEGEEQNALYGAQSTLHTHHPTLLISVYHRSEDIFSLILYLRDNYPEYRLFLRRVRCVPAWELDLIAIPDGTPTADASLF